MLITQSVYPLLTQSNLVRIAVYRYLFESLELHQQWPSTCIGKEAIALDEIKPESQWGTCPLIKLSMIFSWDYVT